MLRLSMSCKNLCGQAPEYIIQMPKDVSHEDKILLTSALQMMDVVYYAPMPRDGNGGGGGGFDA